MKRSSPSTSCQGNGLVFMTLLLVFGCSAPLGLGLAFGLAHGLLPFGPLVEQTFEILDRLLLGRAHAQHVVAVRRTVVGVFVDRMPLHAPRRAVHRCLESHL